MEIYRYNTNGFELPTCFLNKDEYAKIMEEITTNYNLYKDQPYAIHFSVYNNTYYMYFFENRGYNDYNIVKKVEY